jgi:alkanesulfonate monooxygenase SsuD/methylene tetrahydromethanopterin reductase-like flavin-dependent oxidoreductase (luciferase family)
MRLSILDQAPISSNQSAQEALQESMKLAQARENLGYMRYWIAEEFGKNKYLKHNDLCLR